MKQTDSNTGLPYPPFTVGAADLDLRRETLLSMAANVPILGLEIAVVGILAAAVGADGVGAYFLIMAVARLLHVPVSGFSSVVRKRASEHEAPVGEYLGLGIAFLAAYTVLCAAGFAAISRIVGSLTGVSPAEQPAVIAVLTGVGLYGLATKTYDAVGSPGASMWTQAVREAAFVAVLFLTTALTPDGAVFIRTLILVVLAVGVFALVGSIPRIPSRQTVVDAYTHGKWLLPGKMAEQLRRRTPTIVLGAVAGNAGVAFYKVGHQLAEICSYMATPVNDPLLVRTSAAVSDGEIPHDLFRLGVGYAPFVAVVTFASYLAVGQSFLVVLFGDQFAAAWGVLVLLAGSRLLYGLYSPLKAVLNGADHPDTVFHVELAALAAILLLISPATLVWGATGAAGAVFVAGGVQLAGLQLACRGRFGEPIWSRLIVHEAVAGALAGGLLAGVAHIVGVPSSVPMCGAYAGVALAGYLTFLYAVSPPFRRHATDGLDDLSAWLRASI